MRGINRVILTGNVGGSISFASTGNGSAACSFSLVSDRYTSGTKISAWTKINVYGEDLVRICKQRLAKGEYVLVEGELMNRETTTGAQLLEVRAKEIIFISRNREETKDEVNND